MMSVGIWWDGHECGSDWGVIEYTRPRPERGEVGHLMLMSVPGYVELLAEGSKYDGLGLGLGYVDGNPPKMFYQLQYEDRMWLWELFEAHWTDKPDSHPVYIGRWPD